MVVGEFLFLVTKSLKSRRLDLLSNHEICFQNFSFSSRNWRKLQISRSFFANILVLFSNQKTDLDISLFSSRNSRYGFHISLSFLDFTFWHLVNACMQRPHFGNILRFVRLEKSSRDYTFKAGLESTCSLGLSLKMQFLNFAFSPQFLVY